MKRNRIPPNPNQVKVVKWTFQNGEVKCRKVTYEELPKENINAKRVPLL